MPNFSELSQRPLKIIFACHLLLVIATTQGGWNPHAIVIYNTLFFVSLMWAVHSAESDEPLQFALFLNVVGFIADLMILIAYCNNAYGYHFGFLPTWSAVCLGINLILRAFSSSYLLRLGQERNGSLASVFVGVPSMGFGRQDYEDISQPGHRQPVSEFDRI